MKGRFNRFALSLGGLVLGAAVFPALAAPAGKVSVTVNPTTGYFEATPSTYRVPPGVKMSPVKDISAVVVEKLPGGGLAQPISSGIEITALKQSAPVQGRFVAGVNAVRGAAVRCFTSAKCNFAFTAGASGLQALLDGVDWVMIEGSQLQKKEINPFLSDLPSDYSVSTPITSWTSSSKYEFGTLVNNNFVLTAKPDNWLGWGHTGCKGNPGVFIGAFDGRCYFKPIGSDPVDFVKHVPVAPSEIDSAFANYEPDPSDLRWMTPGFDLGHDDVGFEITNSPTLKVPPKFETKYDSQGVPLTTQETNTWHDFDIRDNPSKQPGLDQKTTQETKSYDASGNQTGSSTTITNNNASNSTTTVEAPEMPIDCDLMPSLCTWMDWTQNGWEEQQSDFEERDFFGDEVPTFLESMNRINSGIGSSPIGQAIQSIQFPNSGVCPTGSLNLDVMGYSIPFTLESHCDIWETIRPIISAAFLAMWAVISVRVFLSA